MILFWKPHPSPTMQKLLANLNIRVTLNNIIIRKLTFLTLYAYNKVKSGEHPRQKMDPGLSTSPNQFYSLPAAIIIVWFNILSSRSLRHKYKQVLFECRPDRVHKRVDTDVVYMCEIGSLCEI